jgi:colanic acid biosynthesis glycosyl transferase WcaI
MRVLVVSQYFWPEIFRINELVAELVARGHSVTVLTGRPNYPQGVVFDDYRRQPSAFKTYEGARVLRVPLRPRGTGSVRLVLNYVSFVFWGSLLGPWLLRGQRFDVIFVFETSPITAALPAVLLRWIKKAPLLIWVLDLWPDTLSAVGVVRSERGLNGVGRLVAFIYKRCDRILAQSRAFWPGIARWAPDSERIRYLPAWVEAGFDKGLQGVAVAPEVAPFLDTFNVMFAGNVGEAQDFESILNAAEYLKENTTVRWLIVGDGRLAAWVQGEITRRGLADRVLMLGRHAPERMPAFFAAADALLVSLKAEPIFAMTIPGKVQTYLASGLPLLAMLNGEGARVVSEAGAGLTCPAGDAAGLARLVVKLASMSPAERQTMGTLGQAYAAVEFDRTALINRLQDWMRELAPQADLP